MKNITAVQRPFIVSFDAGLSFPLTAAETQRLLDAYPVVNASADCVILHGGGAGTVTVAPATRGGGPAFIIA